MESYGIEVCTVGMGPRRYRGTASSNEPAQVWDLPEAEETAFRLLTRMSETGRAVYASFGNGEHEFRMWADGITDHGDFNRPGLRWADWYVDVEINGHRWRYRPCADLSDDDQADELAELALTLRPAVTKVWFGASDGSEEWAAHGGEEG